MSTRKNFLQALMLALLVPILVYAFSSGPPSGVTGGFGERNCTDCHLGTPVNGGSGRVTITVPSSYSSGMTYPITVTVFDSAQQRWGFELSARTQGGQQAGTLILGTDGFTQFRPSSNGIQYISHTLPGTRIGTRDTGSGVSFNFTWTAPDVSAGPVVFNAAGNAADGLGTPLGDHIYTTQVTLQPQAVTSTPPAVFANGTVNNASFALGTNPIAPGTIAAIFGTNLDDGSSNSFSSFGSDGKLLTTLGGASATFTASGGNFSAPLFSAFPGQLNVQIPIELAGATSASVQVTVGAQTSPPQTVPLGSVSPGIFSLSQDGKGQGAIQISNSNPPTFAAPAGSIPGAAARPAMPGEFITIFCTGLGPVTPALGTGLPAKPTADNPSGIYNTTATPTVTIDGVPAMVQFSGMAPGFVGLNQVNVQVPASTRSANDIPVVLTIGDNQSMSNTVTIAVSGP